MQDVYRQGERRFVVGRIESGRLAVGDTVAIGAAGHRATITAIAGWPTPPAQSAGAGQSVALELAPEVVVARGDLLYHPSAAPLRARRLATRIFWLRQEPLRLGESFQLRLATAESRSASAPSNGWCGSMISPPRPAPKCHRRGSPTSP
ncbi:sulfate adenylyltransferase, large subunit [mine drainage metagenome]|uniref:Sulfate adenylyltransferase, large subunit n=1 Tax=mine drainage metagenome TaxID=410659 RepID=T0YDQ3_9ZZZZ